MDIPNYISSHLYQKNKTTVSCCLNVHAPGFSIDIMSLDLNENSHWDLINWNRKEQEFLEAF